MLEDHYSVQLNRLLDVCKCDVDVPEELREGLTRRGVIPPIEGDRRSYVRHRFGGRAVLECHQSLPAIPREHTFTQVLTRDLSRGGIGFLHSDQLFPSERISLWLSTGKRSYKVARCVQHNDKCFEIGAVAVGIRAESPETEHGFNANGR